MSAFFPHTLYLFLPMIRKAGDDYLPTNQSMAGPSIASAGCSLRGPN